MTREEAEKKAYERYPDDLGPCDKPSIYDDARTLRIQREAYIAGLLDGSSEKPKNHECLADTGKTLDEAAEKADDEGIVGFECGFCITAKHPRDYFKAGAEWAFGQGITLNGYLEDSKVSPDYKMLLVCNEAIPWGEKGLKYNDDVVVQIRKK